MVKSNQIALFLKTGSTGGSDTLSRIKYQGNLAIAYDAEEETENYIHNAGPTTESVRYTVTSDGEYVAYEDDDVFKFLDDLRIQRKTGENAMTDFYIVYTYKEHSSSTTSNTYYVAEKNSCTVTISNYQGEGGGGKMSISYSIKLNGDPTFGKAAISSGGALTFTADA